MTTRLRSVFAGLVGVIALLGLVLSVVSVWAHRVLFDESTVTHAVERALDEPEVTDALATRVTDQVMTVVDVASFVESVLPPQLGPLAPAIVGGVRSRLHAELVETLSDPGTRAVLVALAGTSHRAFMALLEGDGLVDGVSVADGEVTINFLPLVALGIRSLQRLGIGTALEVPEFTADGDPQAQIAELAMAVDRPLPADFAQVVVYRSESLAEAGRTLARAQNVLVMVRRAIVIVIAVTVAAFVASILLARHRGRAVVVLVLSASAVFVVVRALVAKVLVDIPSIALDPGARAAIAAITRALANGLIASVTFVAALGLVVAVIVHLLGSASTAAPGSRPRALLDLLREHRDAVAALAGVLALASITLGGFATLPVLVAIVLAAVALVAWRGPGIGAASELAEPVTRGES